MRRGQISCVRAAFCEGQARDSRPPDAYGSRLRPPHRPERGSSFLGESRWIAERIRCVVGEEPASWTHSGTPAVEGCGHVPAAPGYVSRSQRRAAQGGAVITTSAYPFPHHTSCPSLGWAGASAAGASLGRLVSSWTGEAWLQEAVGSHQFHIGKDFVQHPLVHVGGAPVRVPDIATVVEAGRQTS